MGDSRLVRGLALLSCLASIITSVQLQGVGGGNKVTGNCTVTTTASWTPAFFSKPDSLEPMQQLQLITTVQPQNGTQRCSVDVGELIDMAPEDEVVVVYTVVDCPKDAKFQLILENPGNIQRMNAIGYLYTKSCQIYWKHMAVYGQSVDLRVLFLEDWKDKFEEELDLFGTPPTLPAPYDIGLANVGSLGILGHPGVYVPFPRILKEYAWFKMAEVIFHGVAFSSIPGELVTTMPQLQTLEIPNCNFSQPPSLFPWNNENLNLPRNLSRSPIGNDHYSMIFGIKVEPHHYRRFLELKHNRITDLTDFQFSGYFEKLTLQGNGLEVIGDTTFQAIQHLQNLDLSSNSLTTLPQTAFHNLTELVHLNIDNNLLKSLNSMAFHGLPSLKTLSLSNNRLASLGAGCFSQLHSLQVLNVALNNLTFIDDDAVWVHSDQLKSVNLASNQLSSIPTWLFLVRNLREVDISDNQVSFESIRSISNRLDLTFLTYQNRQTASSYTGTNIHVANTKVIKLQRNNFTTIPMHELNTTQHNAFNTILVFFHLDVTDNPIKCDCNSFSFYEYLIPEGQSKLQNPLPPSHISSWKCNLPKSVKNIPIAEVPATTFQCLQNLTDCPAKCSCYIRSVDQVVEVDCRNRSLTKIPERVPPATKLLYLDKNGISQLSQVYPYFHNLTKLTLSYNNVSSISDSVVRALTNLTHLNLQNNRLQYLPKALEKMDLDSIALRNNPMVCDCRSKWVKYWLLSQRHAVDDMEDVLCTAGKAQGKHFVEAQDRDYVCEISKEGKAAISMAVFIVVTTFLVILVYRFRGEIKLFLYVHFNWHPFDKSDDEDCDKKYDAFVSYSGIDYRWVCHILRKKVELREPPYRLCLHDRDFMPGYPIQENIKNAIDDSRRMIVILSKNYIQSDWCLYEFRAAHHKVMKERCNYLIVIKCSDVSMNDLDEDLQLYLRTNTYLDVSNKWFWEKLLYTLPQNPLSVLKNSESGQKRKESKSTALPATFPVGCTSPLVVPADATPDDHQSQPGQLNPVPAAGPNQLDATIMPQAVNQQTVLLLPFPQQAGGENGQPAAYIPYQMNLCTMWPANGYVQAPTGEMLCQANGYMPFPGASFLPDENPTVGYQDSDSDSESESANGEDDEVPDSGNITATIEMGFVDTEAIDALPGTPIAQPTESHKCVDAEAELVSQPDLSLPKESCKNDSGVETSSLCTGDAKPLLQAHNVTPFIFPTNREDTPGTSESKIPTLSPDSATPLIPKYADVTCV